MLTGQCKNDFELINPPIARSEIFQTALMVKWFDSVGIYISVEPNFKIFEPDNPFSCFRFYVSMIYYGKAYTRQEATKAAIEKANELYNDKFK